VIRVDTNIVRDPAPQLRGKNQQSYVYWKKPQKLAAEPVPVVAMTRCRWCQWCSVTGGRCSSCGMGQ
jgi:hypothetical protein